MFENRSFDNLLGRLYQPGEVASFEGVSGLDLSNPVPDSSGFVVNMEPAEAFRSSGPCASAGSSARR